MSKYDLGNLFDNFYGEFTRGNRSKMSLIFAAPQPLNRPEDIPSPISGSCITTFDEELDEPDAPRSSLLLKDEE
nr:hypothetical protein [Tanacetum cinerariifolium]